MKTLAAFLFIVLTACRLGAATAEPSTQAEPTLLPPVLGFVQTDRVPGVDLAQGISEITGTAVSPLLGVSAVGAWKYSQTAPELRGSLPWYCHPWVWGTGFALLGLCFLKDTLGTVAPPLVKKPLDMIELLESKLSALVASAAFVPLIATEMARHLKSPDQASLLYPGGADLPPMAMIGLDFGFLLVPLCIVAFLVVWITSHAINVLIALCPFGFIDALLKLAKLALLSLIVLSSTLSAYLGAAVCLVIIAVAAWLAPWAFRLTVFGAVFATDTLLPGRARKRATPEQPHAFTARVTEGVPVRTFGRIVRAEDGSVCFSYRPWLLLPARNLPLPAADLAIGRGVFFPSLLQCQQASSATTRIVVFLPRYRSHENSIASHFEIRDLRDSTLTKGFKAMRNWLGEALQFGKRRWDEVRTGDLVGRV